MTLGFLIGPLGLCIGGGFNSGLFASAGRVDEVRGLALVLTTARRTVTIGLVVT